MDGERPLPQTKAVAADPGLIERGLTALVRAGVAAAEVPLRFARPIVMSRIFAPAREAANLAVIRLVDAGASIVAERLQENPEAADLVAAWTERLLLTLARDPLTQALVRAQAESFVATVTERPEMVTPLVDAVAQRTLHALARNPAAVHALARVIANDYLAYVARSPELLQGAADSYINALGEEPEKLDALAQAVALRFLNAVEADPAPVESVVKLVGDRYIEHLNANPQTVQDLLQGQSASAAVDMVEEVRARAATVDTRIEETVRNWLRIGPRTNRPVEAPPPHEPRGRE